MHLILHNAAHDIPILAELFDVTSEELMRSITFDDTMVMSYVLRLIPQGLKPLERRYNGRKRQSYVEVTREADRRLAADYLRHILTFKCSACGGDGSMIVEPYSLRGRLLAPRPVTCDECEGDGTSWPPPDEYLEYVNGEVKVRRGQKIGTRVRTALRRLVVTSTKDSQHIDDTSAEEDDDDAVEDEVSVGEDRKATGLRRWWMKQVDYDYRVKIEDTLGPMPEVTLDDVIPQSAAVTYSAEDADGTMRIYPILKQQLEAENLTRIYEIDRDTIPLLVRMMEVGTYFDVPYARKLDARLEVECDQILYQLQQTVGHYVNPASPKQVAELLFDELKLPVVKETKTGDASTQDKVLEDLKLQVAAMEDSKRTRKALTILGNITDHRERTKLRGTYTSEYGLRRHVDKNSRIHTTFKSTRTDTNRLSSADPALQNIPIRTDLGALVRGAFAAEDGFSLVAVDLSQIEVRVMAHLCGDKNLIAGITSGVDVHIITASHIFRTTIDRVTKKQRTIAKRITFLILYGGGAVRLRAELRLEGIEVTVEETQTYIDAYLKVAYPGIEDFMDEQCSRARRYGYVETLMGWRRYLPGVHSDLDGVRMESERMAVNAPVQGTAAEIMRMSCPVLMDEVYPEVRKSGWDCDPLLTVHDEVVSQVKVGGEERLAKRIVEAMTGVMKLKIPILAEWKTANRWSLCK